MCVKTWTLPAGMKLKECNVCHGRGVLPTPDGSQWQICPRCHGEGKVWVLEDVGWRYGVEPSRY